MNIEYKGLATNEDIRLRFDKDVERFSNLDTGQRTVKDAALTMQLCIDAAVACAPDATDILDIGCGAGNFTVKMLSVIPGLNCTLVDLSLAMLDKAKERTFAAGAKNVILCQEDMRRIDFPDSTFDVVFAAATLHHLREVAEWELVFSNIYKYLKPGGCVWISDIVTHDIPALESYFNGQFAEHLDAIGGEVYRQEVLEYVAFEDTPRSLNFQIELLKKVGFHHVEILHKNANVAAFGAVK